MDLIVVRPSIWLNDFIQPFFMHNFLKMKTPQNITTSFPQLFIYQIVARYYTKGEIPMKIIKRIQIKQVVTENSKEELREKFIQEKDQLELECQQLQFEKRKLIHKQGASKQMIHERFQQEIKQRKDKIKLIDFKLEQLELLEIGSEIVEKEVDALVDVKVGADWNKIIGKQAIVVEDNKVVRIEEA